MTGLVAVTERADLDGLGGRRRLHDKTLGRTHLTDAEQATLLETFGGR
jgi:hypothetical protein